MKRTQSRKKTPWEKEELTKTQAFLKQNYDMHYADRHRKVEESGEREMINSYVPAKCPFCESKEYKRNGYSNEIQRYMCTACGKTFLPTTGTIFDDHKISISEWIGVARNANIA